MQLVIDRTCRFPVNTAAPRLFRADTCIPCQSPPATLKSTVSCLNSRSCATMIGWPLTSAGRRSPAWQPSTLLPPSRRARAGPVGRRCPADRRRTPRAGRTSRESSPAASSAAPAANAIRCLAMIDRCLALLSVSPLRCPQKVSGELIADQQKSAGHDARRWSRTRGGESRCASASSSIAMSTAVNARPARSRRRR